MVALIRLLLLLVVSAGCATTGPVREPTFATGVPRRAEGLPKGAKVHVTGTFNHWDPAGPELRESLPGVYETFLDLEPGIYRLQLVVRTAAGERWIAPPGLPRYEPDGFGGSNAVVEITRNLRADGSSIDPK